MAKAKANKKMGVELPECPVCFETMSAPIFQCQSGHSLCATCTSNLCPALCPICRQAMTQMRNWQLEEMISKAKVSCPNSSEGCIFTMMVQEVEDHLKECIFRVIVCPLGAVFGKCSWSGKIKDMMQHFKERHPEHCSINNNSDVELDNVSITEDDRKVFLVADRKLLFLITVKIDTIQKMAYWLVQHIGSKKVAQQHVYEIEIISKQDSRRKALFIEYCLNDAIRADEIFRQGKCGIVPLNMLNHFIKDKKMLFRISIKCVPMNPNQKFAKGDGAMGNKHTGTGPNGPGPRGPGPNGPGPRGPGPMGKGHKGPGPKGPHVNRSKSPHSSKSGYNGKNINHPKC